MATSFPSFEHLVLSRPFPFVTHVQMNRPNQRNALNDKIWKELGDAFEFLSTDPDCRSIVLSGAGKCFCSGIDLKSAASGLLMNVEGDEEVDVARKARYARDKIKLYQKYFTAIEECPKPVIVAIHGACFGAGIDMITACDIRYASRDAAFCIKEVDIGLAADVGTLNRLPKIVGNEGLTRELAYTARVFNAEQALNYGLLSKVLANYEEVLAASLNLANEIASKSPVAVQGTKLTLNYSRDHSVRDSLEFVANWNQSQLLSDDVAKSAMAAIAKQDIPVYSKL
uniref:Delta(3,5)-Delta(2,4)-dienoyl-CoA isomerase, mitochondrial n=1 Tax=Plectus sambesii TaxID=2011161 RepID=A0A914VWB6_9BILA